MLTREICLVLYGSQDPYATAQPGFRDHNYPHTNIKSELVRVVLSEWRPKFWLELGSFVGGSALLVAKETKLLATSTTIVCCDPFSGDVNMWAWAQTAQAPVGCDGLEYDFLGLRNGRVTIQDRFLANVYFAGHNDIVIPLQATSVIGVRLLTRLHSEGRLSELPTVVYLDSAHEKDETYLELRAIWRMLPPGALLWGDDWAWEAIRTDVLRFASEQSIDTDMMLAVSRQLPDCEMEEGVLTYKGHWMLPKPANR